MKRFLRPILAGAVAQSSSSCAPAPRIRKRPACGGKPAAASKKRLAKAYEHDGEDKEGSEEEGPDVSSGVENSDEGGEREPAEATGDGLVVTPTFAAAKCKGGKKIFCSGANSKDRVQVCQILEKNFGDANAIAETVVELLQRDPEMIRPRQSPLKEDVAFIKAARSAANLFRDA